MHVGNHLIIKITICRESYKHFRLFEYQNVSTVKLASVRTARRDARFGIRRGRKDAKGQQSLESAATLTLGSMFLARSSTKLQRKIDLTNACKSIFRDDSCGQCSKIAGFLRVLGGRAHACARACASKQLRATRFGTCRVLRSTNFGTCRVPYHEALVRASGKDLAQGQVALLDPI